jgi:hypothetical protein
MPANTSRRDSTAASSLPLAALLRDFVTLVQSMIDLSALGDID